MVMKFTHFNPREFPQKFNNMKTIDTFPLHWYAEEFDDNDNTIWTASSPFHDDGSPFMFRIKQRLFMDNHEFYEASDAELILDDPRIWDSLEEAQQAIQNDTDEIIKEHIKEKNK